MARLALSRVTSAAAAPGADRLEDLHDFGSNPGALRARTYVPDELAEGAPLVVVLHGCTQTAAGYDHGSGWSTLADREGFALLFPEQTRANNANLCFNWFVPADTARLGGEAESIARMVEGMLVEHRLDRRRVYVTGLSAGGAMTGVMLATHPELFAGGAIIGGLPYGCASSVPEAFDRMRGHGGPDDDAATASVRRAQNGHDGPWPTVAIWHGTADATVAVANQGRIGRQWRGIHGIGEREGRVERGTGWERRVWTDATGRDVVDEWSVAGMGHGVPLDASGSDGLGAPGPYMLDVGLSSTAAIARSWGLIGSATDRRRTDAPVVARPPAADAPQAGSPTPEPSSVKKIIEDALRSAGLMR